MKSKIIDRKKVPRRDRLEGEIQILQANSPNYQVANHPGIMKLYSSIFTDDFVFLLTEQFSFLYISCSGGELYTRLIERGVYPELKASLFFKKVFEALNYLHIDVNIIHRDLKPENILLIDDLTPKLIDFGISKLLEDKLEPGVIRSVSSQF